MGTLPEVPFTNRTVAFFDLYSHAESQPNVTQRDGAVLSKISAFLGEEAEVRSASPNMLAYLIERCVRFVELRLIVEPVNRRTRDSAELSEFIV